MDDRCVSKQRWLCGQPVLLGSEGAVVTWLSVRPILSKAGPGLAGLCAASHTIPERPALGVLPLAGVLVLLGCPLWGGVRNTGSRTPNDRISNPEFRGIRGSGHSPGFFR